MIARDISAIKEALSLSAGELAQLVGVHHSSVYRWMSAPEGDDLKIDPGQLRLLEALRLEIAKRGPNGSPAFGKEVSAALRLGGGLFGLYKVLSCIYEPESASGPAQLRPDMRRVDSAELWGAGLAPIKTLELEDQERNLVVLQRGIELQLHFLNTGHHIVLSDLEITLERINSALTWVRKALQRK